MLVLTRKTGEDFDIQTPDGEKIIVRVTRIKGKQVCIGVIARKEVKIDRSNRIRTPEQNAILRDIIEKRREL